MKKLASVCLILNEIRRKIRRKLGIVRAQTERFFFPYYVQKLLASASTPKRTREKSNKLFRYRSSQYYEQIAGSREDILLRVIVRLLSSMNEIPCFFMTTFRLREVKALFVN